MLEDFLQNATLLISTLFLLGTLPSRPVRTTSSLKKRLLFGAVLGILGIALMYFAIHIEGSDTFVDLRHITTVIAALYGGMAASLVSAALIGFARVVASGPSEAALVALIFILLIGAFCGVISQQRLSTPGKAIVMNLAAIILASLALSINLRESDHLPQVLQYHWLISALAGAFTYYIAQFIHRSQELSFQLKKITQNYDYVVNSVHEVLFQTDTQGRWTFLNRAWSDLTGFSLSESLGRPFYDFIHPEDAEQHRQLFHQLIQERSAGFPFEARYLTKDGGYRWVEGFCNITEEEGRVTGTTGTLGDVTERKLAQEQMKEANQRLRGANLLLQQLTHQDELTGIGNRRSLDERLKVEWKRAKRNGTPLAFILLDIDFFKLYNDTYGHQAGDACLQQVAHALAGAVHRGGDGVFRYGGEEFAVILPQTDRQGAEVMAERIRRGIEELKLPHPSSPIRDVVTVSLGLSLFTPDAPLEMDELVNQADKALYRAKSTGRNRYCLA